MSTRAVTGEHSASRLIPRSGPSRSASGARTAASPPTTSRRATCPAWSNSSPRPSSTRRTVVVRRPAESLPAEVDEDPTEVVRVLLHPVVERLHLLLLEEAQDSFLQLAGPLAGNDLDERRPLGHGLVDDRPQRPLDLPAVVVDVVKVELQLHPASGSAAVLATPTSCPGQPSCAPPSRVLAVLSAAPTSGRDNAVPTSARSARSS